MSEVKERFTHIREVFSSQGTRFDSLFDVLDSLDVGIERTMEGSNELGYIAEKLRSLTYACEMVKHDTKVFLHRKGLLSEEEFKKFGGVDKND